MAIEKPGDCPGGRFLVNNGNFLMKRWGCEKHSPFRRLANLATGCVLSILALAPTPALATDAGKLIDAEGVVQEVLISDSKVLITGILYEVVPHANVEVRGSSSSIAALRPGMKVRFVYEVIEGFDAEIASRDESSVISELEQLPDSYLLEEF